MTELATAAGAAPFVVLIVQQLRTLFPRITSDRAPGVTLLTGPLLLAGAWVGGFLPEMTIQAAVEVGIGAAAIAMGGYSGLKALREGRPAPQP